MVIAFIWENNTLVILSLHNGSLVEFDSNVNIIYKVQSVLMEFKILVVFNNFTRPNMVLIMSK